MAAGSSRSACSELIGFVTFLSLEAISRASGWTAKPVCFDTGDCDEPDKRRNQQPIEPDRGARYAGRKGDDQDRRRAADCGDSGAGQAGADEGGVVVHVLSSSAGEPGSRPW